MAVSAPERLALIPTSDPDCYNPAAMPTKKPDRRRPGSRSRKRPIRRGDGRRAPLSHVGGAEVRLGDAETAERLSAMFHVGDAERDLPIEGVHGIHPYPARMHPAWVRHILAALPEDVMVYDPFCGSGTVLVEASESGRPSFGSDINGIAVRVAKHRTRRRRPEFLERFAASTGQLHAGAAERRETAFGKLAKGEDRFPRHVLAQLISLRDEIEKIGDGQGKEAALMTMSGLLPKFAARPGRPAPEVNRRAVRDHFLRRAEQAAFAWADHTDRVERAHPGLGSPRIERADARRTPWETASADAVISSPPYPGVYDYAREQELRSKWIGDAGWLRTARRDEIGRRRFASAADWAYGMLDALLETARVAKPGAPIYLVLGDGSVDRKAVRVPKLLQSIQDAKDEGKLPLKPIAAVGRERPNFHGPSAAAFADESRREYLILLERMDG